MICRTNYLQRGGECARKQGEKIEQGTVRQQYDLIVERLSSRARIVEDRRAPMGTIKSAAYPGRDAAGRVARDAVPDHVDRVAIGVGRNRVAVIEIEGSGVSADAGVVDEHGRRIPTRAGAARAGDQNGAASAGAKIVARRKTQSARIHGAVAAEAHPGVRGAFDSWHRVLRPPRKPRIQAPAARSMWRRHHPKRRSGWPGRQCPSIDPVPIPRQAATAQRRSNSPGVESTSPGRRAAPGPVKSIRKMCSGGSRSKPARTASAAGPSCGRRRCAAAASANRSQRQAGRDPGAGRQAPSTREPQLRARFRR